MAKILFISDNNSIEKELRSILSNHEILSCFDATLILDSVKVENPDIVIFDGDIKVISLVSIYRQIKEFNTINILLVNKEKLPKEILSHVNMFISYPFNPSILKASVSSSLKTQKSMIKLAKSNKELANSLYQLNVLYNTTSQLSGHLDKGQLISIMDEGIEKSLNYNVLCTLTFKNANEPVLLIDSMYNPSERLIDALKLRAIMIYKSRNIALGYNIDIENIKVEKRIKNQIQTYDFEILNFDNMLSFIDINEECHGFTEIFREKNFTLDDSTCFQTIVQQASLPLKSATLYQEITEKNKKLAKLERLKSEFISIVSHELRTPLTTIKNALDIILSGRTGDVTENAEKFLNMAKKNVGRLSGIIDDLLDMSKIEAGKLDLRYKVTNIDSVIESVKNNLQNVAKEKQINIETCINSKNVNIFADSNRLEQVLSNLVSNAIKFTDSSGKITISLDLVNSKDINAPKCFKQDIQKLSGDYIQVCVEDQGIGIEQENLKQVFDKFQQIENSLSREVGGSGLGLAIASQLIESHNGAIWCDSEINKGSRFYFVIPVSENKKNFTLLKKQLIQKAKTKNTTLLSINIQAEKNIMNNLLNEKDVFLDKYVNNSLLEESEENSILTLAIVDAGRNFAELFRKKIDNIMQEKDKYKNCDIMYSYVVEGVSDEKNSYSR